MSTVAQLMQPICEHDRHALVVLLEEAADVVVRGDDWNTMREWAREARNATTRSQLELIFWSFCKLEADIVEEGPLF